jgi:hypothetical protein
MKRALFVWLASSSVLVACGGSGQTTGPGDGTTGGGTMGAAFVSVTPQGGMTGVSSTAPLSFRFGGPMAPGMEQYFDMHVAGLDGPTVPMTCGWSPDRSTLTCDPGSPLQPHTTHAIHMGGGLTDASGRPVNYDTNGSTMGGQWIMVGTMPGMHDGGMGWGMMGGGWRHGNGSYGMVFTFTTA